MTSSHTASAAWQLRESGSGNLLSQPARICAPGPVHLASPPWTLPSAAVMWAVWAVLVAFTLSLSC